MKRTIFALVLALALPANASAQQACAPTAGMMRMHAQVRTKMLGLLMPVQKALLAKLAGQLSTTPNPDLVTAARQLDAALLLVQKQEILSLHRSLLKPMQPMRGGMKASGMGGEENGMNDPGAILIEMAVHWGPMRPHMVPGARYMRSH